MSQQSHISTGFRKILELNIVYKTFQYLVGDYKLYRRVLSLLPSLENKSVMDVGCGNGRLLDFLPESVSYSGYDFNPDYIKNASIKYADRKASFFVADINTAPDLAKADVIFAIGVLHHLSDESCITFLNSASRHLNPSGIVVTVDPVYVENQNPIAKKIIQADRGACVRHEQEYLALSKNIFGNTEHFLLKNVTNIPYNHIIILNKK
ncbi:MAG: class I SAM-dependent methyltransferase [Bacteroidetes bacterium]|nr:class I SAM-dependent methyltransferase [Bacteroidota bacterium]